MNRTLAGNREGKEGSALSQARLPWWAKVLIARACAAKYPQVGFEAGHENYSADPMVPVLENEMAGIAGMLEILKNKSQGGI